MKKKMERLCIWLLTLSLLMGTVSVPGIAGTADAGSDEGILAELSETPDEAVSEELTEAGTVKEEITEEPAREEPAEAEPTKEEPGKEETAEAEPTTEEPATEETEEEGLTEEPTEEESATEEPAEAEPTKEGPGKKETEEEELTKEEPATEETEEEGLTEEPTEEESATEETEGEELTEEETEEESTEEETAQEEIPEDDIEYLLSQPMPANLGDITQVMDITSCQISGGVVIVEGRTNIGFTTWDRTFYLFEEGMYAQDISGKPIAQLTEGDTFRFEIPLNLNTADSRLYSKFFVGVRFRSGKYVALSNGRFITNPEVTAPNQSSYPTAKNKKGILAEAFWGTDLDELGISYANVNFEINEMFDGTDVPYTYNGKTYYFSGEFFADKDSALLAMKRNNIIVTGILLMRPGENARNFTYPGANTSVGIYHGWNVATKEGIECVSAAIHCLAERYGRTDQAYGHVAGWIVGNEVNADTTWNYTGHQPVEEYALIYANMMRITYLAVRSACAHCRVYMSLDMYWNKSADSSRYDGKKIVNLVNDYMKAEGDIPWGIAFHPYSDPLTEPEFWNDHAEQNENAAFISMQNISVLTSYVQKANLRDPDGSVKRVLLSEQGYTSYSNNQGDVSWKQAAAYAYAYYITAANPYIDAFIAMRQRDAQSELEAGLHQGLWYDNVEREFCVSARKPAWTVWKYIDTNHSFEYTDSLAPLVGLSSFSEIYAGVISSNMRTLTSGTGGYAADFLDSGSIGGTWSGEYMIAGFSSTDQKITVTAGQNSPFAYTGIVWEGRADFSSKSIFGFDFTGTAGENQNLRVRIRFTSGQSLYETEIAVQSSSAAKLYADLSGWSGKSGVSRIQIWVQQDGTGLWENGSFTISNICQASAANSSKTPYIRITDSGSRNVTADGFDVYCTVEGTKKLARAEFCAWYTKDGTHDAQTVYGTVSGNTASAHFNLSSFGGRTGVYSVRIVAYDADGLATKETVVNVTVKGKAEALVVSNGYATGVSQNSFTLVFEASSDYGLSSSSAVAVWSVNNGQDDLVWYPLQFANGTAKVTVSVSGHKNDSGQFYCHAYVRDNGGNEKLFAVNVMVPSRLPEILSAQVTNVSLDGFDVTCTFNCYYGVREVKMPTWSDIDGQDDLIWYDASVSGSTATLHVDTRNHKSSSGLYYTHIYLYDRLGNIVLRSLETKVPQKNGLVLINGVWYYQTDGKTEDYTGLAFYNEKWRYVENGSLNTVYTGLAKFNGVWFYVKSGILDKSYTGLVKYNGVWFYVEKGMLNKAFTDLVKYNGAWFYIQKGMLDKSYTGLVKYNGVWFYAEKGMLNKSYTGLVKFNGVWFYAAKGMLDRSYTGLARYNGVLFYVKDGMLDRSYTGYVIYGGKSYHVTKGQADGQK